VRDARLADGVAREAVYGPIFLLLAGLLALGLIAALLVKPVASELWVEDEEPSQPLLAAASAAPPAAAWGLRFAAWSAVLIPLAWGGWFTVQKAVVLLAQ
jgi:hypothetical protein